MRLLLLISYILCLFNASGQSYEYYLLGRPNSFEFNNALRDVGRAWQISFNASGSDVYDQTVEAMQRHNDSISVLLSKTKGENWYADLLQKANEELKQHTALRDKIKREEMYMCRQSLLSESYVLIECKEPTKLKRKKYRLYLIGNAQTSSVRKLETIAVYCWNGKQFKLMDSVSRNLPFAFPVNGIN